MLIRLVCVEMFVCVDIVKLKKKNPLINSRVNSGCPAGNGFSVQNFNGRLFCHGFRSRMTFFIVFSSEFQQQFAICFVRVFASQNHNVSARFSVLIFKHQLSSNGFRSTI